MKPKVDLKYSQWICSGCYHTDEYKDPMIADEKGMRIKKLKFHVDATTHFRASGCYVKVSEMKEQIHLQEMPVLFDCAWSDFPLTAQRILADLYVFFPDQNFDDLSAKMAFLQVDQHAASFAEKETLKAWEGYEKDTSNMKTSEIYLKEKRQQDVR